MEWQKLKKKIVHFYNRSLFNLTYFYLDQFNSNAVIVKNYISYNLFF